ncbi:hypothetical protein [Vibrio cortegadensis]|uniref:hypothetical protein n=1 Tax=Vibrio cortegadensis TaxID=1328770 RepID=UPI00352D9222
MKKIVVTLALLAVSMNANAGKPEKAGKTFAQITACHLAGKINKSEKAEADFAVIGKYKVATRGEWWKKQMKKTQMKEFKRLDDTNKLELGIMCGIIEDKYL